MIKQILLFSCTLILVSSFIPNRKKNFLPPGTVKINDTLFADETEISNLSWLEYVSWIKNKYGITSAEYKNSLPDTLVWRENNSYNEPYVQYYLRHSAYNDYPVVGISYEQATAYCKWRTERIKELLCISKKYELIDFEYRLPSKKEWEFISNNGEGCFSNGGKDEKGRMTSNRRRPIEDTLGWKGVMADNADVTAPVYAYWKNKFGLYNMIGNVAEMVSEKGICKGGGWRNNLEECRVGSDNRYERPTAWLGFRCICVVRKKVSC